MSSLSHPTSQPPRNGSAPESLSVVIPALDEEDGVVSTLREVMEVLRGHDDPWEILVVDDGSRDHTVRRVEEMGEEKIRVIRRRRTRGYGAALRKGIEAAGGEWILIIDADGTYPAEHIPEILDAREGHDMVVGARTTDQSRIPWIRRPPKWILRRFASFLSGMEIADLNSGLRVFRRSLALRFASILPAGFSFTSTITLATLSTGGRICYVPIDYRRRSGRSKIRPIRDTMGFFMLIVRTVIYFDPLRVLLPISVAFFVAACAVAFGSYYLLGELMDVTTVVLLVTAFHMLTLGVIADAINRRLR